MSSAYDYLKSSVPNDSSHQTSGLNLIKRIAKEGFSPSKVLDLGCGTGASRGHFSAILPKCEWVGIDIEDSPEVNARKASDATFLTFDGVNLPFEDNSLDLIYSHQVFEHVRQPEQLLKEIARVLSKDGLFVGQTSHLEPYHSFSIFNFTPYGWKLICEENGLDLDEIRPGIDGMTLMERTYLGKPKSFSQWFVKESPINRQIEKSEQAKKSSHRIKNFRKLMISGQFSFICSPSTTR